MTSARLLCTCKITPIFHHKLEEDMTPEKCDARGIALIVEAVPREPSLWKLPIPPKKLSILLSAILNHCTSIT